MAHTFIYNLVTRQYSDVAAVQAAAADEIAITWTDLVPTYRKLEIMEGWRKLYNLLRDFNVIPTAAVENLSNEFPIDKRVEAETIVSSPAGVTVDGNVSISIGESIRNAPVPGVGAADGTVSLEERFRQLRNFARLQPVFRT